MKILRVFLVCVTIGVASVLLYAQASKVISSSTLPSSCSVGAVYAKTGTSAGWYVCLATNTWTGPYPTVAVPSPSDDTVPVGNGSSYDAKTLPNCIDSGGNHLNYTQSTNTFSCGTTGDGTGSGSGGGLVFLETHTASSSSTLDFTSWYSSTYDEYQIEFVNVLPATDAVTFYMRVGTGGGPTWDTGANYSSRVSAFAGGTAVETNNGATQAYMSRVTVVSNDSRWGLVGTMKLFDPANTSIRKMFSGHVFFEQSPVGAVEQNLPMLVYDSTTAVTGLRFFFSSGNIASGTIRVYGIAKS